MNVCSIFILYTKNRKKCPFYFVNQRFDTVVKATQGCPLEPAAASSSSLGGRLHMLKATEAPRNSLNHQQYPNHQLISAKEMSN